MSAALQWSYGEPDEPAGNGPPFRAAEGALEDAGSAVIDGLLKSCFSAASARYLMMRLSASDSASRSSGNPLSIPGPVGETDREADEAAPGHTYPSRQRPCS